MRKNQYARELSRMCREDRLTVRMLHFEVLGVHQSAQDPSRKPLLIVGNVRGGPTMRFVKNHEEAAEMAARKVRGQSDEAKVKGGKK